MRTWWGRRPRDGRLEGRSWRLYRGRRSEWQCYWRRCGKRCGRRRNRSLCWRRRFAIGRFGLPVRGPLLDLCLARGRHRQRTLGRGEGKGCGFEVESPPRKAGLGVDSMKGWAVVGMSVGAGKRQLDTKYGVFGTLLEELAELTRRDYECERVGCWRPRSVVGSPRNRPGQLRVVQLQVHCSCRHNCSYPGRRTRKWGRG